MATAQEWARGFARQADADFRAWELYEKHPEALTATCHKLLFLQMACEKRCKAHMILAETASEDVRTTHRVIAKNLPLVIREEMIRRRSDEKAIRNIMRHLRHLSQEIEYLAPAVKDEGQRPDNCEYPWEAGGSVVSPLTWGFSPLRLCFEPSGRTFLKLLRCALNSNLT